MWRTSGFRCVLADLQLLCAPNADARGDACNWFGHHNYAHQGHFVSIYGDCGDRSWHTRKSCRKIRNDVPKYCCTQNWTGRTKVYVQYAYICMNMHLYVIIRFICSFRGIHDCLVPVTPYLAGLFKHLRTKSKLSQRVRAMDMRHVLLNPPFLLEGLLTEEFEEHTRRNPVARIVNPSPMMMEITIMLLSWY